MNTKNLMKKIMGMTLVTTLLITSMVSALGSTPMKKTLDRDGMPPGTVYVDDDFNENTSGWGVDHFATIQNGINAVANNGTVHVEDGFYQENIVVNKSILLLGHDKNLVMLYAKTHYHVVTITADNVCIGGFTIAYSGGYRAGILIDHSDYVTVMNNIIRNNAWGIAVEFSQNCLIQSNMISNNVEIGVLLEYSPLNTIYDNTVMLNGLSGIHLVQDSNNNRIYRNNLIDNEYYNAYDSGMNTWDGGNLSYGNYWSDYTGSDNNSDGIGDTPYIIPGLNLTNMDRFPLMHRFILGDMNCDGTVNFADINPFVLAMTNPEAYRAQFHILPALHGDINQDGSFDFGDINPFTALISGQ